VSSSDSSDDTATAAEPAKPAQPPVVASTVDADMTAKAQRRASSKDKDTNISYLEKAFTKHRLTLAQAVTFLINHKELIEDIELLKPLADYYTMKTQAFHLNPVQEADKMAA
jgi:hypothetical protein